MMNIQDLIEKTANDEIDICILLRKSMILANELKNDKFTKWINFELMGYPRSQDNTGIPNYRILEIKNFGDFEGFNGSTRNHIQLADFSLKEIAPDHLSWYFETLTFTENIKSIQELSKAPADPIKFPWDANVLLMFNKPNLLMSESMVLQNAYHTLNKGHIIALLEQVRIRLLAFLLEIKSNIKDDPNTNNKTIDSSLIEKAFEQNIMGNNNPTIKGNNNNIVINVDNPNPQETETPISKIIIGLIVGIILLCIGAYFSN